MHTEESQVSNDYCLEVYAPDSRQEVLAVFYSDKPFGPIARGDSLHPGADEWGREILPDALEVTHVQHMLMGEQAAKHKICVFTRRIAFPAADGRPNSLSLKERLHFSNQLKILEQLNPSEAKHYAEQRQALEEGYALHYTWMFEHLWDGLSVAECRKVLDILDMYRALTYSADRLRLDELKKHFRFTFRGFDGNNETAYMAYVQYFIVTLGRFDELTYGSPQPYFNSHAPMLETYERMLAVWQKSERKFEPSAAEISRILDA
jgi:uncharacterized protein